MDMKVKMKIKIETKNENKMLSNKARLSIRPKSKIF
jgi:hypothetical protein